MRGLKVLSALLLLSLSSFRFEAARTPEEIAQGYMYRETITDDEVMLFILPQKQILKLWMHNVKFDLDAAFLDDCLNIIEIRPLYAYPEQKNPRFFFDKITKSPCPVKYAMEAKAGFFESRHFAVGDSVRSLVPGKILHELRIHQPD